MTLRTEIIIWAVLVGLIFIRIRPNANLSRFNATIPLLDWFLTKLFGKKEAVVGFGPMVVPAGEVKPFQVQPQFKFWGKRLIIPSSLCQNFEVCDIRVGKDSQAVSSNPIPAAAFSELGVGVDLSLALCKPGILITLLIKNSSDKDQTFAAALVGLQR